MRYGRGWSSEPAFLGCPGASPSACGCPHPFHSPLGHRRTDLRRAAPYRLGRRSSRRGDYPSASGIGQTTTTRYRTINLLSIGSGVCRPLRPDYPAAVHPCGRTLRLSVAMIATSLLRYSFRHSHSSSLHRRFRADFGATTTLPYRLPMANPRLRCIALPRYSVGAALLDQ